MNDLYIVVEGKGEQTFIDRVVAPHLAKARVWVYASLIGKPGHKGGVRSWVSTRKDLVHFLKMNRPDRPVHVTTMFDFHRLPLDWPGRKPPSDMPIHRRATTVEELLLADVSQSMGEGFIPDRFIPYVQMHELEALILSQASALSAEFPNRCVEIQRLVDAVKDANPEEIDDGPNTAPSARIIAEVPEYKGRKASAAPNVLEQIGLEHLRFRCPHFEQWMTKLETLGS